MLGVRKKRNIKKLQLTSSPLQSLTQETVIASPLVLGLEFQLDLQADDLQVTKELGHGSGGSVDKVLHLPTKTIMAKKTIRVDTQPQVKRSILRELKILHDCNSPHIVSFYGAFMHKGEICICMEYMDTGYLLALLKVKDRWRRFIANTVRFQRRFSARLLRMYAQRSFVLTVTRCCKDLFISTTTIESSTEVLQLLSDCSPQT